jgi:CubicO group peptidase (beta-lactamase class C family)
MTFLFDSKDVHPFDAESAVRCVCLRFFVALALICLIGLSAIAHAAVEAADPHATAADPRLAELREDLAAKGASGDLASVAIGVVSDGRILWAEAFGWADRESKRAATVDTRYGIASIGKSMVATSVLQLVEAGTLELDDRVDALLPATVLDSGSISTSPSLRQLLDMGAGIAHGAYTYVNGQSPAPGLAGHRRALLAFAPGEVFHYSNFSIDLVDQVLEKETGQAFEEVLQQRLFKPLAMGSCAVEPAPSQTTPATRYFDDGSRVGPIVPWPQSSRRIHCSLIDLLRYAAFHLKTPMPGQQRVLSTAWIDRMHSERSALAGAHMALGIGSIDIGEGRRWLITSGQDMGVQASITMLPDKKLGVVVLSNSSGNDADEIGIRAADAIVPGFAAEAIAAIGVFESHTTPWHAQAGWIGAWRGHIDTANGPRELALDIQADGDLLVTFDDQYPTRLSEAQLREGLLTGAFLGKLPLEEASPTYHRIELSLVRHDGKIEGFAVANFRNGHGKFELPTRVVLERKSPIPQQH